MSQRNTFAALLGVLLLLAAGYYFFSVDRSRDLVLIGTVDANQVLVGARITGRIEKLAVDEGSQVQAGDLIALLDARELSEQQRAAEAMLASYNARVQETQATERVAQGATASEVGTAEARAQAAQAQLREAQAELERVRSDYARTVQLAQQGVASQQERDRGDSALQAAQARTAAAQDQVRAGQAEVNAAKARTNQAQAAGKTVAATRAQAASAAAEKAQAETRLGYARVTSPVSGTVSLRVAREGEVVAAGAPIVTVVDLRDTWVRVAIPETHSAAIQLGDVLKVRLPSGETMDGRVMLKAAEAGYATQRDVSRRKRDIKTIGLKLSVANPGGRLTPGMTAEVLVPEAKLATQ